MATSIDEILKRLDRETARKITELKERGLEPAPDHDQVGAGLHLFGFTLRWPNPKEDIAEVRLGMSPDDSGWTTVWGEGWPGYGARLSSRDLLAFLVSKWPTLAHGHLAGSDEADLKAEVSFASALSRPDLPRFDVILDGKEITVATDHGNRSYGVESVIVVEVLAALGDVIAGHLEEIGKAPEIVTAWKSLQESTDLPPFPIEGDGPGTRDTLDAEADWYAKQLGISPKDYRLAAIDVHARQLLFAAGRIPHEPTVAEHEPDHVPADLPSEEEIYARAAEAAASMGMSPEQVIRSGINDRNILARQVVLYSSRSRRSPRHHEA